jgi:Spy/CpxP family protein refolding chaperone
MTTAAHLGLAFACLTAPLALHAQHVISGMVKSETGQPIEGANVYINDLAISVLTNAQGAYVITVPAARLRDSMRTNVRARAVGHTPGAFPVMIRSGVRSQTLNMTLRYDGSSAPDSVPVRAITSPERAKVPFAVARGQQLTAASMPGNDDVLARHLFPPELVMQHQAALELSDTQRARLHAVIHETQTAVLRVQWELSFEGEKLNQLLAKDGLDEEHVLAVVDRIMGMEREIKRAHMTLMVRIKNTLHPTQQAKLRELRK